MSEEQPTPEQIEEMRAQVQRADDARREELEAQADERLGTLPGLVRDTLTDDLAKTLDEAARNEAVTGVLADLINSTARMIRLLPVALNGTREQVIGQIVAEEAASEEPAAEE